MAVVRRPATGTLLRPGPATERPPLEEMMGKVFFDTCVCHRPAPGDNALRVYPRLTKRLKARKVGNLVEASFDTARLRGANA